MCGQDRMNLPLLRFKNSIHSSDRVSFDHFDHVASKDS